MARAVIEFAVFGLLVVGILYIIKLILIKKNGRK